MWSLAAAMTKRNSLRRDQGMAGHRLAGASEWHAQRPESIPATIYIGAQLDRPNQLLFSTQETNTETNTVLS